MLAWCNERHTNIIKIFPAHSTYVSWSIDMKSLYSTQSRIQKSTSYVF